jgi:peptide/nickel transport system substrate-binding protein
MISSRRFIGIMAAAVAMMVAGCAGTGSSHSGSTSASAGGTLSLGLPASDIPANFNPALALNLFNLAYAPLIHINDNGSFGPALAQSFGYVGSGDKTFQLTLRQDAKFSDGTPVTAQAVTQWLTYYAHHGLFDTQIPIASIETPSPYKVVINLKQPTPGSDIEWNLAQTNGWGYIASPAAVAHPAELSNGTYGAGPYEYDPSQSQTGSEYTFVANPYYYDKSAVHFTKVVVKEISNSSTMIQALSSGQIDIGVGDYTARAAAAGAGLGVVTGQDDWVALAFLRVPGSPWASMLVRQAVNYAIDRQTLTQAMIGGQGFATSTWLPADGFLKSAVNQYPYDPAKSRQLLRQAGYPNGVTLTVVDSPGQLANGTPDDGLVQAVAQQLQQVGVTLKITTVPASQMISVAFSGKYEGFLGDFGINNYATYIPIFITSPLLGELGADDATVLRLSQQYMAAPDPGQVAQQVSKDLTDGAAFLPIYAPKTFIFLKKGLQGVTFPTLPNGLVFGVFPDPTEWHY